jgi:hypothetical protein
MNVVVSILRLHPSSSFLLDIFDDDESNPTISALFVVCLFVCFLFSGFP